MVNNDLYLLRARSRPTEADPELVVHADTVLPGAIARERLKPIARRNTKVFEFDRNLELSQLAARDRLDVHEPLYPSAARESLRIGALERYDHEQSVTRRVNNVKRDGYTNCRLQDKDSAPLTNVYTLLQPRASPTSSSLQYSTTPQGI